jgi:protease-4
LVDSIGVGYDAKNRLAQLSGVVKPVWNEDDKIDRLMKKLSAQTAVMLYTYFPDLVMK